MIKQLKNYRSFSIIEIIIALVFSAVLLTTFISLSAWGLNNTKDNEVEDIASQSLIEMNDFLRAPSSIPVYYYDSGGYSSGFQVPDTVTRYFFMQTSVVNPGKNYLVRYATPLNSLNDFNIDVCKNISLGKVNFTNSSSVVDTQNVICVLVQIQKVNGSTADNRYYYSAKVVGEKSGNQSYEETIDGMRVGNFDNYTE